MVQVENTMTVRDGMASLRAAPSIYAFFQQDLFFCIFVFLELIFCISGTFTNKRMINHETTLKNHGNQPKTVNKHETTLKKPWKPTEKHETTLKNHGNQPKTMKKP